MTKKSTKWPRQRPALTCPAWHALTGHVDDGLHGCAQVAMFADDLSEFDDSREIVQDLIEEYRASETADSINWGLDRAAAAAPPAPPERMPGERDIGDGVQ